MKLCLTQRVNITQRQMQEILWQQDKQLKQSLNSKEENKIDMHKFTNEKKKDSCRR